MEKRIIASTKFGYEMPIEEALKMSGLEAGICYLPEDFDTLANEDESKTIRRYNGNMNSKHHSVFGHVHYNFLFEGMPKILAMTLNNEKAYCTSEKSARYTKMETTGREQKLYEKWIEIFSDVIGEKYSDFDENTIVKLAKENARYLISVFTPATTMGYTVSLQQMSYILHMMDRFVKEEKDTPFNAKLKEWYKEFIELNKEYMLDGISPGSKNRKLSFISSNLKSEPKEEFGYNYTTVYYATFAQLAQAQRHRTISYEIIPQSLQENRCYIPPIIRNTDYVSEWLGDYYSLSANYPQGRLVKVVERGTVDNFILKCKERLCGCAQLEIQEQTRVTLNKYIKATDSYEHLRSINKYLRLYANGPRCTFPDYECSKPCIFGPKNAFNRII